MMILFWIFANLVLRYNRCFQFQVGIDKNLMKFVKDDLDFTQKLISAKSVFCLPGSVSAPLSLYLDKFS